MCREVGASGCGRGSLIGHLDGEISLFISMSRAYVLIPLCDLD